ncbi:endonuclease domain-containing protein [Nocardia higoensis]|uniref:endonuclease domain-containing protein n=1 Tax=Nocardia higoensis TaxID=228599 RepID=UPI002B4AD670|nr:endonuclease domain-containing protein [Nocardia higoensis]
MARQTIVSTQQAERIIDQTQRHIRPIFGKCYGYPYSNLGEYTRSAVVHGPRGSDLDAVIYRGELTGYRYRADRAGRRNEGWPHPYEFMCAACLSTRAEVWDHCHTHRYVRAPLCRPCNTRHWTGWNPQHGRAAVSRNLDPTYYRWCPDYDADENSCTA